MIDARRATASDARGELAQLRRRAYGPDADIDGDADAVARLAELEHSLRGRDAASHASDDAARTPAGAPADQSATGRAAGASLDSSARPDRNRPAAGRVALIVAVAVASALLGVAATIAVTALTAPRSDVTLRAVDVDPATDAGLDGQWLPPFRVDRADLQAFEEYRGLRPWAGDAEDGLVCLFVTSADRGLVAHSCTAPSIAPVADGEIGNGTVSLGGGPRGIVRFELRGDVVEVYDRHVPVWEPTS